MIRASVEIREGALTHRVRIIAPPIERALKIARAGKPGRGMRLAFPVEPEALFGDEGYGQREVA